MGEPEPEAVAREIALRRLTVRARTRAELAADLARRNVPAEAAASVLDRFTEVGLIDDADYARMWVAGKPGVSSRRLKDQLRTKGVSADDIDAAVGEITHDDDLAAARAFATKRLRSLTGVDEVVRDRRLAGALARRGFGPGIVAQVLRDVRSGECSVP
jgi:regulatory protein